MPDSARYTAGEEIANSATHSAGLLLSIAGLAVMLQRAIEFGDIWHRISSAIFGGSLITLYASSAVYHGIRNKSTKLKLQLVDHSAIYVLIAGTYTPFMLVNLRGPWGWSVLAIVWSLAIVGIVFEFKPGPPRKKVTVGLSVAMGWCGVVVAGPMLRAVETDGLLLILLGGILYTTGIGFYLWRSLRHHHAVWHLFVLAGSAAHYFSVLVLLFRRNLLADISLGDKRTQQLSRAELKRVLAVARGDSPADLLLKNVAVLDLVCGDLLQTHIAISGQTIAGVGNDYLEADEIRDLDGLTAVPGFIDGHLHVESSLMHPFEFERLTLPLGTTAAICDPHEITNVMGDVGYSWFLRCAERMDQHLFVQTSSCVPASARIRNQWRRVSTSNTWRSTASIPTCWVWPR